MGLGYQRRDLEIVDYKLYPFKISSEERVYILRGPQIDWKHIASNNFFVSIGAAFTFGCYCEYPYPSLLEQKLNLPSLNFGFSGAGPLFFICNKPLIRYINKAKFAIVLVMSGRSESNTLFESHGKEMYTRRSDGIKIAASLAYQDLIDNYPEEYVRKIIAETKENYINNYRKMLSMIKIPKILLWFSERPPEYQENYQSVYGIFSKFPQLVNRGVIEQIMPLADSYVECVTNRGMPQQLISRFTGKPTTTFGREDLGGQEKKYNNYYASAEMHEDAANSLLEVCQQFV